MIDFTRPKFNKVIKTVISKHISITSKYPLVDLSTLVTIIRGVTYPKTEQKLDATNNVVLTADNITLDGQFNIVKKIFVADSLNFADEKKLYANDIFMCFASGSKNHIGKVAYIKEEKSLCPSDIDICTQE